MQSLYSKLLTIQITKYYVYEWWRTDVNECFYVGKGSGGRAWSYQNRNHLFWKVIDELNNNGFKPEGRIYKTNLTEKQAFRIERERMAYWHRVFAILTNISGMYRRKSRQFKLLTHNKPPKIESLPKFRKQPLDVIAPPMYYMENDVSRWHKLIKQVRQDRITKKLETLAIDDNEFEQSAERYVSIAAKKLIKYAKRAVSITIPDNFMTKREIAKKYNINNIRYAVKYCNVKTIHVASHTYYNVPEVLRALRLDYYFEHIAV